MRKPQHCVLIGRISKGGNLNTAYLLARPRKAETSTLRTYWPNLESRKPQHYVLIDRASRGENLRTYSMAPLSRTSWSDSKGGNLNTAYSMAPLSRTSWSDLKGWKPQHCVLYGPPQSNFLVGPQWVETSTLRTLCPHPPQSNFLVGPQRVEISTLRTL